MEYLATLAERYSIPLMLDPAPARELPAALLRKVTWLTPNETEAGVLLNARVDDAENDAARFAIAEKLAALGAKNVLLKLGHRGCLIAPGKQAKEHVPAFTVDAVDTTAAGDAFNAAFAVGLLQNKSTVESAIFASAVAAISVTRRGAQASLPTKSEVEHFLRSHSTSLGS